MARKEKRDIWYHFDRALDVADRGFGIADKHAGSLGALAALINIERKYYDVTGDLTFTTGIAGAVSPTANLPQGDGQQQCIGNSIKLLSCYCKFLITPSDTYASTSSPQRLRIIIVADREAAGASPTLSDVLEVATANRTGLISPLKKNLAFAPSQQHRFRVMHDHVHALSKSNNPGREAEDSGIITLYWDQKKGLGEDWHCVWSDDAHSATTTVSGAIYIFFMYVNPGAITATSPTYAAADTTNPPGVTYYTRIVYTDD